MKKSKLLNIALSLSAVAMLLPASVVHAEEGEKEILYWVAPMDPNYRRDKPGKSPMGMDLVPVYADAGGDKDIVKIDPDMVQNLGVRSEKVVRGKLWRRIDTVGYVTFDEDKFTHVHLRTDGWIEKLYVKYNGEEVKKGAPLFELYSRDLVNAQEEYIQALRGTNKHLVQASVERLGALGMSQKEIRKLAKTRKAKHRVTVYASQDGIIHDLKVREGMYVKPAVQIMSLADLSSIWLLVDVFERQTDWVATGQPADVLLPYLPGEKWEGKVDFIYPTIDPKTRTLRVRLRFDNPGNKLKPNMYADVKIYAGPKDNVLSIPRQALIHDGDTDRVILALGGGKFKARTVVAGIESGDWVEIKSGLREGEEVVISGQFLIDSEASLKASFTRMGSDDKEETMDEDMDMSGAKGVGVEGPITGMGKVNKIMAAERKINLSHGPIEALGWPEMTMNFGLTDDVDIGDLKPGQSIHFTLEKDDEGNYRISQIHIME